MTESGQYVEETIPERPTKTSRDVADEIANELVHMAKYHARCKLSQKYGRPIEYSIETLPFAGNEDYQLVEFHTKWSRERLGRNREDVKQAIEKRLQIKSQGNGNEEVPIIREKAKARNIGMRRDKAST